jgi:hypothetical protein
MNRDLDVTLAQGSSSFSSYATWKQDVSDGRRARAGEDERVSVVSFQPGIELDYRLMTVLSSAR